nr:MAG TPA: hypothetical protein [Caudoviricetes sp.]
MTYDETKEFIKYDEKLEEMFDYVYSRLINAYDCFIRDDKQTNNDNVLFYNECTVLAICNMLSDEEERVSNYTYMLHGTVTELRHIGAIVSRLTMIEDIVEMHEKTLQKLGINSEEVLKELYLAISKLRHFLWELVPPAREQNK